QVLDACSGESSRRGLADEWFAAAEQGSARESEFLASRRVDGVTDKDIRWYWNLSDIDRCIFSKIAEIDRTAMFVEKLQDAGEANPGGSIDEFANIAMARVRKFHPFYDYGSADDGHTSGDDKPIPPEL